MKSTSPDSTSALRAVQTMSDPRRSWSRTALQLPPGSPNHLTCHPTRAKIVLGSVAPACGVYKSTAVTRLPGATGAGRVPGGSDGGSLPGVGISAGAGAAVNSHDLAFFPLPCALGLGAPLAVAGAGRFANQLLSSAGAVKQRVMGCARPQCAHTCGRPFGQGPGHRPEL